MMEPLTWDVAAQRHRKAGERLPGDICLVHRVPEDERLVMVLADGLGSGVKANVLANLTATMAARYAAARHDVVRFAETIRRTLPVCQQRGISYATFSIADLTADGQARIAVYGNPPPAMLQAAGARPLSGQLVADAGPGRQLTVYHQHLAAGESLILVSDGITQAGMGGREHPFGWRLDGALRHLDAHQDNQHLPARLLAKRLANRAHALDAFQAGDDITCGVCRRRPPRRLNVITGPPYLKQLDADFAASAARASGAKLVLGGTTAEILAREWQEDLIPEHARPGDPLPPFARLAGADLVTEGILTLTAIHHALAAPEPWNGGDNGQLDRLCSLLVDADAIDIQLGAGINTAHFDPNLSPGPPTRRQLVEDLARLLRDRYAKQVQLRLW